MNKLTAEEMVIETLKENASSSVRYNLRKARIDAKYKPDGTIRRNPLTRGRVFLRSLLNDTAQPLRPGPFGYTHPGAVLSTDITERGLIATCKNGMTEIVLFSDDLVRIRYLPLERVPEPVPYAIAKPLADWPVPLFTVDQVEGAVLVQTASLIIGLRVDNGLVFFADPEHFILRVDMDAAWHSSGAVRHRSTLTSEEHIFGLGERAMEAERRGHKHILWNTDPGGYESGMDPIDMNIPVYIGITAPGKAGDANYLVFYENPFYAEFDLGEREPDMAEHRFAGGELRYYFTSGTIPKLIHTYTELTGRHPLQPLWMLGYQQSRWSYETADRVRELASNFAKHNIPCDAIHLDIHYMDGYRCFTVDQNAFPNLPKLAQDLRQQGIKLISIIDPGIKQDPDYEVYREGVKGGHFSTMPDGKLCIAPVWPGDAAFPDFSSADTRLWWGGLYQDLIEMGIAGFWNDMNEPAAFTVRGEKTLPDVVTASMEGRGGNQREAHNLYGMLMERATREGLQRLQPEKRPVVFTRAGWAGVQRYGTSWTGDNHATWDALALSVYQIIALGLSGVGFTGADVGGFIGSPDGELFTRWIQAAAFMPMFRAHTALGTDEQDPWSYGEPYLSIVRRFIELRYELLPYLYTATWQMTDKGYPVVRPVWWNDNHTNLYDVDDVYLCGDSLAVAPITQPGATEREVLLPDGTWYDYWTNTQHEGHQTFTQFAPLELIPLYVKAGSILTLGEIGTSVEQRKLKFQRLHVYPQVEDGTSLSELYEDAGEGMAYQQGKFRISHFEMTREGNTVHIQWHKEGAYTPPYEHCELVLHGLKRAPRAVVVDGDAYRIVANDPVKHTSLLGVPLFDHIEVSL